MKAQPFRFFRVSVLPLNSGFSFSRTSGGFPIMRTRLPENLLLCSGYLREPHRASASNSSSPSRPSFDARRARRSHFSFLSRRSSEVFLLTKGVEPPFVDFSAFGFFLVPPIITKLDSSCNDVPVLLPIPPNPFSPCLFLLLELFLCRPLRFGDLREPALDVSFYPLFFFFSRFSSLCCRLPSQEGPIKSMRAFCRRC